MNTVFLKYISDYLRYDRVEDDISDKVSGFNSIIKPFNNDLIDNKLFIMKRVLSKMAFFAVFPISIHFSFTVCSENLVMRHFLKKKKKFGHFFFPGCPANSVCSYSPT